MLASLAGANAKSYDAVLYNRVKAGATLLQAGYYMVKVKGDNAVFTAVSDGKNYTTPVKVDNDGSRQTMSALTAASMNRTHDCTCVLSTNISSCTLAREPHKCKVGAGIWWAAPESADFRDYRFLGGRRRES